MKEYIERALDFAKIASNGSGAARRRNERGAADRRARRGDGVTHESARHRQHAPALSIFGPSLRQGVWPGGAAGRGRAAMRDDRAVGGVPELGRQTAIPTVCPAVHQMQYD